MTFRNPVWILQLLACAWPLVLSTGHAQTQAVRSYAPDLQPSSRMGSSSRSVAIGGGMIAVGAPLPRGNGSRFPVR